MIIEAGLGLCVANLPTVYGLVGTKGIQDLINGFQSIFSTHSASRENKTPQSSYVEKKTGQSHPSDLDSEAQSILRQISTEPEQSDSSFELRTMVPDRRIRITQDIDIASHTK